MVQIKKLWSPEEIKALRVNLRMSQQTFATRLGFTLGAVSNWERGIRKPSYEGKAALDALEATHAG